jgi:hypothetical protein
MESKANEVSASHVSPSGTERLAELAKRKELVCPRDKRYMAGPAKRNLYLSFSYPML